MSLHRIETAIPAQVSNGPINESPSLPPRYNRNVQEDMKEAIDALFAFKRKLDTLHPVCIDLVSNMLQNPHGRF